MSADCTVAVTPHVSGLPPPASLVIAGEPTGSEDSAIVTAMAVLPRPVTASAAVRGSAAPKASATTSRRSVRTVCAARASYASLHVGFGQPQQSEAIGMGSIASWKPGVWKAHRPHPLADAACVWRKGGSGKCPASGGVMSVTAFR